MSDWYPYSRDKQLHLINTWLSALKDKVQEWGVPQELVTQLTSDAAAAADILQKVEGGERISANVVQCNAIFKNLQKQARFIKKHYFLKPPLTDADFPTLLLPLPDVVYTPVGAPTGQPSLNVNYSGGPHIIVVHLSPLTGSEPLNNRGDYGYALYRGVMPQGGATVEQAAGVKHYLMNVPLSGDELLHYKFTRRKKELVSFDASESGMTAYFCARYENQKGEHGVWGPVVAAIIP
jgi:hypothetical protein